MKAHPLGTKGPLNRWLCLVRWPRYSLAGRHKSNNQLEMGTNIEQEINQVAELRLERRRNGEKKYSWKELTSPLAWYWLNKVTWATWFTSGSPLPEPNIYNLDRTHRKSLPTATMPGYRTGAGSRQQWLSLNWPWREMIKKLRKHSCRSLLPRMIRSVRDGRI